MALLIQKFGGTSVADDAARHCLVQRVMEAKADGKRIVVVVSAMGRRGAPYATDTLLDLLDGVEPERDPLSADLIASCGETIAACLVSALLRTSGIPSRPLDAHTAGIRAVGPHGDATPVAADVPAIMALLENGLVPVLTGFQGVGPGGELLTLGRGGSDTSAVALGAFLGADRVDIYTDVPGVAKADPRVISEPEFMDFLDYDGMFRLAAHGARVLHDKSALLAREYGVLVSVRSTFKSGGGTLIGPSGLSDAGGRKRQAPDFLGLTLSTLGAEKRVCAVFSAGRGARGIAKARAVGLSSGACLDPDLRDADALAFRCRPEDAQALSLALYRALA